tara:strand:+ start:202 stop:600 length:399 start_codon:yes stop_codon:yes gene_type:complete
MNEERMVEVAKKYLKLKLTEDLEGDPIDLYCYTEATVDGYDVWVLTEHMDSISISDNVFYYDSDLADAILEEINHKKDKETLLYIDSYMWDDLYMNNKILEYFGENAEEIIKDVTLGLTNEEIEFIKSEFGI